jgi:uncharacterized Tic20 family protein
VAHEEPANEVPADEEPVSIEPVASDSRGWAVAAHLVPFIGMSFLGPLIIWLIKRDEDPFVEVNAREATNFQISVLIYLLISGLLILVLIGIPLFIAVAIFAFVAAIVAAVKAADGKEFRYPLTIRLISR